LEEVKSGALEKAARGTVSAVGECYDSLVELRESVKQIQAHMKKRADWPVLLERFSLIDRALALSQGSRPDQENADARKALPETLEALRNLMKEVSTACDNDPTDETSELVDEVYSQINKQIHALENVGTQRNRWNDWLDEIVKSYNDCANAMDVAAIAVSDGARGKSNWESNASKAINSAVAALNEIANIEDTMKSNTLMGLDHNWKQLPVPYEGFSALESLRFLLHATQKSLTSSAEASARGIAYRIGEEKPNTGQVHSVPLSGPIFERVQAVVNSYFTPGTTTQAVRCIAVCWPVWVVYSSNSQEDKNQRNALIASALYWRLIWKTKPDRQEELTNELAELYMKVRANHTA
jgi:hypothetical protein